MLYDQNFKSVGKIFKTHPPNIFYPSLQNYIHKNLRTKLIENDYEYYSQLQMIMNIILN